MKNVGKRSISLLVAVMVSLPFMGCNVARVTLNTTLTPESVAFIVPGKTTFTDVVTRLGAPETITDADSGVVATYRFLDIKYSRVNFGWLAKPWTPVDPDLIFSRTGLGVDEFQVFCNLDWVVVQQGFQRSLTRPPFHPYPF
ncbi:MAG: hypothetical protein E8D48_16050 [Nitrospira sp.]|nr:MAG: hypothetical protein E8D48_16050 [Nitrospira sp.]